MKIHTFIFKVKNNFFINYCYLVTDKKSKNSILIDPAWEIDPIENKIKKENLNLKGIFLTHHHYDHINLSNYFSNKYEISVFMSKDEIDFYNFSSINLIPIEFKEISKEINFFNININIIKTPGHTYGGLSFFIEKNLFCGDTLFIEGCGICFEKGSDPKKLFYSLQNIKNLPLDTIIFPGHSFGMDPGKNLSYVLKNNIYMNINNEESFINYRMRKNQKGIFNFK